MFPVTRRRFVSSTHLVILLWLIALQAISGQALGQAGPAWHTQTNIYQVFVEKFSPSKTLQGVEDGLDYLRDLGIKTIWLMPIFEAMDDHGYNTTDYYKIAARYGTQQDLKDLVTAAHAKDMRVILDLVINHTGTKHPWFSSPDAAVRKDHWFIWANRDLQWDDPWNHNPNPAHPARTWFKDPFDDFDRDGDGDLHNDDYYYSVFGDGSQEIKDDAGQIVGIGGTMPDLNFNDAAAKNEIVAEVKKIMGYWVANTGVDGFRCDAVRYLSEFGAGNQADEAQTHEVWKKLRSWLDANHPGAILLAEAPTETYAQMRDYYGAGDEFHSAFHFKFQGVLMTPARQGVRPPAFLPELYEIQSHLPENTQDVLFLSNHDNFAGDRVASQVNGDPAKVKLAASLYLLLSGNPAIYYGEEIAMTGAGSDDAIRKPFDWNTARSQSFDENSVLNHYKRLLQLRNQYDALRYQFLCACTLLVG
jgi:alpha-amylase